MVKNNRKFTKKKALIIIGLFALVFLILILIKGLSGNGKTPSCDTLEGRKSYLRSYGWEIDASSENAKIVTIPSEFGKVMEEYCSLQKSQGFDLEKYKGKECTQYTYTLTNYPENIKNVYITIYICNKTVIAGDIHTPYPDGFMHAFIRSSQI